MERALDIPPYVIFLNGLAMAYSDSWLSISDPNTRADELMIHCSIDQTKEFK
jgi:hypothetical protein